MSDPYVCAECGKHAKEVDHGVMTTLCSVDSDGDTVSRNPSAFKSWYCMDCFWPEY